MPFNVPCCPVTKGPYEAEGLQQPRSLPCGHSISYGALVQILEQRADRRQCPIDRNLLIATSAAAYPANYALMEVIATLSPAETPPDAELPLAEGEPGSSAAQEPNGARGERGHQGEGYRAPEDIALQQAGLNREEAGPSRRPSQRRLLRSPAEEREARHVGGAYLREVAAEKLQYERRAAEKQGRIKLAWEVLRMASGIGSHTIREDHELVAKAHAVLSAALDP